MSVCEQCRRKASASALTRCAEVRLRPATRDAPLSSTTPRHQCGRAVHASCLVSSALNGAGHRRECCADCGGVSTNTTNETSATSTTTAATNTPTAEDEAAAAAEEQDVVVELEDSDDASPPLKRRLRERGRSALVRMSDLGAFRALFARPATLGSVLRRGGRALKVLHNSPNVYLIEDFLTEAECRWLNELVVANARRFQRSFTDDVAQGAAKSEEIADERRTSTFMWLPRHAHPLMLAVEQRASSIVGLSHAHLEPFQIVNYKRGQRFDLHHDAGTLESDDADCITLAHPRRLFSFFVYLNDTPEGTGQTLFPRLITDAHPHGLGVQAKRRAAALWCNVLEDGQGDVRVVHRGCPVPRNVTKQGMNIWVTDAKQDRI